MKNSEKKNPLLYILIFAIGLIAVCYVSLLAGAYVLNSEEEITFISALLMFPDLIKIDYKAIYPINTEALQFGVLIYILAWGFYWIEVEMNKKTMPGKEYGTAAFMSSSEIKNYRKKYMDKTIYTEGLSNPNVKHNQE